MDFSEDILAKNNQLIRLIKKIRVSNIEFEDELRLKAIDLMKPDSNVLDCGRSLRNYFDQASQVCSNIVTLDINKFKEYPDWLIDICDINQVSKIPNRFDIIIAFNLLEHCYNPFAAAQNLKTLLKDSGGIIIGSAPFLFPHHGPENLSYQDYFRFTRDSYALIFPDAQSIELFAIRGRLATSLNVLTLRYRFIFEKNFRLIAKFVNKRIRKNLNQLHLPSSY